MKAILWGKFRQFIRKPGALLITTIICIAFSFLLGKSSFSKMEVPVFTEKENDMQTIIAELNKSESYSFKRFSKEEVKKKVEEGEATAGLKLSDNSYTLYRVADTADVMLINRYVEKYYQTKQQKQSLLEMTVNQDAEKIVEENEKDPILAVSYDSASSQKQSTYNQALQALFGFTLFFSIYTVAYTVVEILRDKQNGIWDRFILSSTSKTQLYLGHLLFSFIVGYIQIMLIFSVFNYALGVDFSGKFYMVFILIIPYLYAIVALAILLTGLVKTASQFTSIIPLISVSFAMLGGAYWPLEIVTSKFLLLLSKFVPITYGMEMLKKAIIQSASWTELLLPIAILMLMGTLMLGIGIRLIERRHV
ncbi:ABC transporter permease [Niallia nealsonii]|uniref:ABC transporter permease n=1 Tax=Niallia nealsonii TaxID=115979 RepID=A0A2N0Z7K4_9BACI|nr:ABC transporter permease [Niallia nealsonii]PKG25490.1 ABC transporter permease [Niallia nealsonii]